jgi:hypothetical protein
VKSFVDLPGIARFFDDAIDTFLRNAWRLPIATGRRQCRARSCNGPHKRVLFVTVTGSSPVCNGIIAPFRNNFGRLMRIIERLRQVAPFLSLTALVLFTMPQPIAAGPHPVATPLPIAAIKRACLDPTNDMKIAASAYADGYLLCVLADEQSGGEDLYQESPRGSGRFTFVRGAGGWYQAADLVKLGVDSHTAKTLYETVRAQLK